MVFGRLISQSIVVLTAGVAMGDVGRPTYTRDIAPILNANCVTCHRPGESAPMSLTTYDEVRPWAKAIAKNVGERVMPPWHADKGVGVFVNDRSLSDNEIKTIVKWVDQGGTQGDPKDMPPLPEFPSGEWRLGEPDMVVSFKQVDLPAAGDDQFYRLPYQLDMPEDRWLRAVEVRPSNRKVTHHVIVYQMESEGSRPNGWLAAWAAGMEPMQFPEKTGRLLKKNATLVGDMHYHPADTAQSDVTTMGLYFEDASAIEKEVINLWIENEDFEIPAGDSSYHATSSFTFPQDSIILSFLPHMHYRGKSFSYTAKYPNGRSELLMSTSNYDFNWQTNYILKKPLSIPKGTKIECVAEWDNSANNPRNPDPTKTVMNGQASFDEMMIGFVDYVVKDGARPEAPSNRLAALLKPLAAEHPGEVYELKLLDKAENPDPPTDTVLYLPREGDGTWHIVIGGNIFDAKLKEIVWQGSTVKAKAVVERLGTYDFNAVIDESTGKINGTLTDVGKTEALAEIFGTRVK